MLRRSWTIVAAAIVGTGCVDTGSDATTTSGSTTNPQCHSGFERTTSAGGGWSSEFVSQQLGYNAQMQVLVTPQPSATGPIDGVIGFSSGPATKFSDLGPIVRFNADGKVDARDGSVYRAAADYPYATDGTAYVVYYRIDFDHHTYSATVGPYYQPWVTIADNYAFRTEQAAMSRVDNLASFIDGSSGGLLLCDYAASAQAHPSTADSGWVTTPMLRESGRVKVDVVAYVTQTMDAVVGLAAGTPSGFSDLAAIARFSPDGIIDVRDGSAYRADTRFEYVPFSSYHLIFDVDVPSKTYDVTIYQPWNDTSVQVARGYHFRTEQSGATSLSSLGQFVDGTPGTLETESLKETY